LPVTNQKLKNKIRKRLENHEAQGDREPSTQPSKLLVPCPILVHRAAAR
jgi:hypothetical protein